RRDLLRSRRSHMTLSSPPAVSVLVATRNRAPLLGSLLRSLEAAQHHAAVEVEILAVDNGSTDDTAELLARWAVTGAGRRHLSVPQPGKSRALTHALRHAQGGLLAFIDDDEQVAPSWLQNLVTFFAEYPEYQAAVGRVLPPADFTDPEMQQRVACYRT